MTPTREKRQRRIPMISGVGDGATITLTMGSSGNRVAAILGVQHMASTTGKGALPLPTTLPSMTTLKSLTDDLEKLSEKMFQDLEDTNIAVYDMVLKGFKDTSGKMQVLHPRDGSIGSHFLCLGQGDGGRPGQM